MLTLVLALIDRPQKLDNIVTETQSLMDEMGQLEEQFSDSLNEMKENLSEATTDMSSKSALLHGSIFAFRKATGMHGGRTAAFCPPLRDSAYVYSLTRCLDNAMRICLPFD